MRPEQAAGDDTSRAVSSGWDALRSTGFQEPGAAGPGARQNSGVTPGFSLGRQARCPEPKNTDRQQEWHDATCAPIVDGLLHLGGDAKEPGEHTGVGLGGRGGLRV